MYHSSNIGLLRLPEDSLGIPRLAGWCETVEAKIGVFWAMSQFLVRRFLGCKQGVYRGDTVSPLNSYYGQKWAFCCIL